MTETLRLDAAKERVEDLTGFYTHLLVYVLVNFGLFVIDAVQGDGWWFYWATLGWGIGVLAHAVTIFFSGRRIGSWKQHKMDKYLEEMPPDRHPTQLPRGFSDFRG